MLETINKLIKVYEGYTSLQTIHDIITDSKNYIHVYTDGASAFINGKRLQSIGVFFGDDDNRNVSKIVDGGNNNEAEIIACIEALSILKSHCYFVNLYTDSRLVVDGMTQKCSTTKYELLFNQLYDLSEHFIIVNWIHVKGHEDKYGNIQADLLTKRALKL